MAGQCSRLLKHAAPKELVATLRRIVQGEHTLAPSLASRFLREFQSRQAAGPRPKLPQRGVEAAHPGTRFVLSLPRWPLPATAAGLPVAAANVRSSAEFV